MQPDFWKSRWAEGRIGFHEGQTNPLLLAHQDWLLPARRILVPLCGKAEDVAWLAARGHVVVGVELVEDAVRAFFDEHQLVPKKLQREDLVGYQSERITLWAGDFFATTVQHVGAIDGLYDRAALVALPEAMRSQYAEHLRSLLAPQGKGLVVTFEYPQALMEGPPFSVSEAHVRSYFSSLSPSLLERRGATGGRLGAMGAEAHEVAFGVTWQP